jgi:hypothetical protein
MSRSPAILYLADGTELYGLWNGTVDVMWSGVYPTIATRDEAWGRWHDGLRGPKPCTCDAEECIVLEDQYSLRACGHVFVGKVCRTHGFFQGPYQSELDADANGFVNFSRVLEWWNDPHAEIRSYAREHRITVSRAFEPLLKRILPGLCKDGKPPAPLDELVIWK